MQCFLFFLRNHISRVGMTLKAFNKPCYLALSSRTSGLILSVLETSSFFSHRAGEMKLNILARPIHWGFLLLCIVGFCSQPVSSGNQSSRGQTGRSQTRPGPVTPPEGLIMAPGHQPGRPVESSAWATRTWNSLRFSLEKINYFSAQNLVVGKWITHGQEHSCEGAVKGIWLAK